MANSAGSVTIRQRRCTWYAAVALAFPLVVSAGAFVEAKTPLKVAHWWTDNAFKAAMAEFTKQYPSIEVKQDIRPWDQYLSKMLVETAAAKPADVYMVSGVWFPDTIFKAPIYKPLNQYAKSDKLDLGRFAVNPQMEHGKGASFYALPQWMPGASVLWVNKVLAANAGVVIPEYGSASYDTWRPADLVEAARKLTRFDASGKATNWGIWPQGDCIFSLSWTMQNGAELFDDPTGRKTDRIVLTSKEYTAAIQWLYDLRSKYKVAPAPNQTGGFSGATPFHSGKIGFFQGWSLYEQVSQAKFDWAMIPIPWETRKVTFYGNNSWAISAGTKRAADAWKFIKFMTTDPRAQKAITDSIGTLTSYDVGRQLAAIDAAKDPRRYAFAGVQVSRTKGVTFRPQWFGSRASSKVIELLDPYLQEIWTSKRSVPDGLAEAERRINKVVYGR